MIIGDTARLAFQIGWPDAEPAEVAGLGWGSLTLWIGGHRAWATARREAIDWTWIDLVEHLARAWGHLLYEENAPYGLVAAGPEQLGDPKVLERVADAPALEVADAVHAYQHRHDLAAGLKGIWLPPVWILPAGRQIRVRFDGRDLFASRDEIIATLERFVDAVIVRVRDRAAPRAEVAIARWLQREPSRERRLLWRSGLTVAQLRDWTPNGSDPESYWLMTEDDRSPMLAAARLSEGLRPDTRRALVSAIRELPTSTTPDLDTLTAEGLPVLRLSAGRPPYEQGYELALWLRTKLGLEDQRVDPLVLLRKWGVHVGELSALQPELDAIACWGAGRGPAVLVNPEGKHAQSEVGRRATLAHEIAHLLVDRGQQLPAAEVFGGATPVHLEQRARAFAAEFLLPREVAAREVARSPDLHTAKQKLIEDYEVSREVLGWQIKNGPGWSLLNQAERGLVNGWCRQDFSRDR